MPVFYFDILSRTGVIEDDQGQDFPGVKAARDEAILSAREQMAEAIKQGLDVAYREFRVRNQDNEVVFTLPFRTAMSSK